MFDYRVEGRVLLMKLRDHPLISYRGVHSWPPTWNSLDSEIKRHPNGEVGILKEVRIPINGPFNRCFLVIEHHKSIYMGCLLIDDIPFCDQVIKLLRRHCGESIASIGSLDLSHTA
jgi:hypothetical protein